jgi:hypothetical protein
MSRILLGIAGSLTLVLLLVATASAEDKKEEGFTSIFDGQSLKGWQGGTGAYEVKDAPSSAGRTVKGNLHRKNTPTCPPLRVQLIPAATTASASVPRGR